VVMASVDVLLLPLLLIRLHLSSPLGANIVCEQQTPDMKCPDQLVRSQLARVLNAPGCRVPSILGKPDWRDPALTTKRES